MGSQFLAIMAVVQVLFLPPSKVLIQMQVADIPSQLPGTAPSIQIDCLLTISC